MIEYYEDFFLERFIINNENEDLDEDYVEELGNSIEEYLAFCYINNHNYKTDHDYITHQHHIIPRCMGGENRKENYTRLTVSDHIIAHELLITITDGADKIKMRAALQHLLRMEGRGGSYGHKQTLIARQDIYLKYKPTFVNFSRMKLVKHKQSPNASLVLKDIIPNRNIKSSDIKVINSLFHLSERGIYSFWFHNRTTSSSHKILEIFKLLSEKGYLEIIELKGSIPNIYLLKDKFTKIPVDFKITDSVVDLPAWSVREVDSRGFPRWKTLHTRLAEELPDLVILIYRDHYMFTAKQPHLIEELDAKYNNILYKKLSKSFVDKMIREEYSHIFKGKPIFKL